MRYYFLLLILLLTVGCSPQNIYRYRVEGADEFVIDSHRIRQGKMAILEMQGFCVEELPSDALYEYKDVIAEDDILHISAYHPTRHDLVRSIQAINQSMGFEVVGGKVRLPDLGGVVVEGLTLLEAKAKIEEKYQNEVRDLEVFIKYKNRLQRRVELAGSVATAHVPVDGKLRLFETLAVARVPNTVNLFNSYMVRDGKMLPIDFHALVHEGDMSQNIVMRGKDRIYIANPVESRVMVMGEVLMPRGINMTKGSISLREALVNAGGIPFTGNRNCIQVIRGGLVEPKIYQLSWEHIVHLPNDSLLLIPGDTVYVSETPITQWNRFISQLLPSLSGVSAFRGAYDAAKVLGTP